MRERERERKRRESRKAAKVQRVGAATRVVHRGLNDDVTFRSGAEGRGRTKERWQRSKVSPAGSSLPLTALTAFSEVPFTPPKASSTGGCIVALGSLSGLRYGYIQ